MRIEYGRFKIDVLAEKEEVNGPNELALSDKFAELEEVLWEALQELALNYPEFDFILRGE